MKSLSPVWAAKVADSGNGWAVADIVVHLVTFSVEFTVPCTMTSVFFFTCSLHAAHLEKFTQKLVSDKSLTAKDIMEQHININKEVAASVQQLQIYLILFPSLSLVAFVLNCYQALKIEAFVAIFVGFVYNFYFLIMSYLMLWGAARVSDKFDKLK